MDRSSMVTDKRAQLERLGGEWCDRLAARLAGPTSTTAPGPSVRRSGRDCRQHVVAIRCRRPGPLIWRDGRSHGDGSVV